MSEAEEAWRLWHLLQKASDALWDRYESAFLDFCAEDDCRRSSRCKEKQSDQAPF